MFDKLLASYIDSGGRDFITVYIIIEKPSEIRDQKELVCSTNIVFGICSMRPYNGLQYAERPCSDKRMLSK